MNAALNPHSCFSLYRRTDCGDFCIVDVLKGMPTNHFSFVGTHFKTSWESKGMAIPLALGYPIGAGSALLAGESKGDRVPLAVVSKGGGAALAGGIQRRAEPSWQEESKETGVSWHTTLRAKSSVLYLWRPWVAERDCSGREQSLSVSHRTGGFCVLPDEKPRSLR